MTSAASVSSRVRVFRSSSSRERVGPLRERTLLLQQQLRRRQIAFELGVLGRGRRADRRSRVQSDVTPVMTAAPARCTCATRPNVTAWSTGTPDFEVTCAEISTICATTTAKNRNVLPRRLTSRSAMTESGAG